MKLYFLCLSALTVGALCKIDDVCIVQSGKKGVEGKCQKKGECMKAGLAAFSKSGRTDISGNVEELACPGEDEEVQCCVELKCGAHTCRNNVESNPCAEGVYVANFRDRNLCPSSSSEDNVQCCVENPHNGLKRRQNLDNFDVYGGRSIRGSAFRGSDFATTSSNGNGLDMASASGVLSTLHNNDAPSVGTDFTPISPFGGSVPTTPDTNIALPGDVSTSADTLGALPITSNTIVPAVDTSTASVTPNTDVALGGSTSTGSNIALPGDVSTSADTLGALPITSNTIVPAVDTSTEVASVTPNTDVALGGSTSTGSSNFNLAQIDNYSQSAGGLSPGGSGPDEGLSIGLNHGLRPEVTYTNGGGSTFSLGTTTPVTNMLGNLGSSFSGIQGGVNIGFRKLKRSLADALN